YAFKQRYLLEVNARYDGSSRISSDSRWGIFPSFSLGWRVTEEEWMKELNWEWLNSLKLRGSWGILVNQNIDLYSYYASVTTGKDYSFDNSNLNAGVAQTALTNRDLKWESTSIGDFGIDITAFNGFNVTFDWYKKRTYDILREAQSNSLLGLKAPYINAGEMVNKGIEVSLAYNGYIQEGVFKGLSYNAGVFFDRTRNELTKYGTDYIDSSKGLIYKEGLPYESYYGYEAIGIFKDEADVANSPKQFNDKTLPGDIKYADISGPNGVPDGVVDENDRKVLDGRLPDFEYTVNLAASWKGFDLSAIFAYSIGGYIYNRDITMILHNGSLEGRDWSTEILKRWTPDNRNTDVPALSTTTNNWNSASTRFLQNNSYMRLKNLTLSYNLPKQWISKLALSSVQVY
ncbi:SusC/RagA family TonB-linked outer membrane protein, partial [Parabacteroides distasonis]|uniref:SusC/RagA family TonB-linked outer membrane protein n=1 Tax=Parabacteroides distasonis TaxID=823 RepID=UPI00135F680A